MWVWREGLKPSPLEIKERGRAERPFYGTVGTSRAVSSANYHGNWCCQVARPCPKTHLSGTEVGVMSVALVSGRIVNVPAVLQSQAPFIATAQKHLKIHRISFLLWRLTRRIRVQRRVRQFLVFVVPTSSPPYRIHSIGSPLDPF